MPHDVIVAVLAGLGGMVGWGLADFFAKKTIDQIGDVVSLVLAHIFGTLVFFGIVVWRAVAFHAPLIPPDSLEVWAGVVFFGLLQAAVYLFVYRGFGKGQLAVLNPIFASFSGLTAALSILAFGELVTGQMLLALATIFLGVLLINLDVSALRNWKLSFVRVPGFPEIAVATLLAAFWTLYWDQFVNGKDWFLYAALMYLFMTVGLIIYAKVMRIGLAVSKPHVWKYLALIGICETGAYLAISWGYGVTAHTSVVAVLSGAFSLPTIVLARIFLKEQTTRLQTVASAVIIGGIILLNLN